MKPRLLEFLACPDCGSDLTLEGESVCDGAEIMEGTLSCSDGKHSFSVVRGVPRFADLGVVEQDKVETASNFGWQWNRFTQEDARYADQLLGWLQPVSREFFDGKLVLEGGCGKGRHTALAALWGAGDVVGIDLSAAVEAAFAATRHLPNAHIVQADIFKLPFKRGFDYAFSVGVLHHTPDPKGAFESLASKVRENGHISAWVYGAENNRWITGIVNPIREGFTSKIPQPVLYQLSKLPTLAVYLASKLIYRPLDSAAPKLARMLFYNEYMNHIGSFGWREQHNIVFDHLVAPTAFYISKQEFETWWKDAAATEVQITWHNANSWCGFGKL